MDRQDAGNDIEEVPMVGPEWQARLVAHEMRRAPTAGPHTPGRIAADGTRRVPNAMTSALRCRVGGVLVRAEEYLLDAHRPAAGGDCNPAAVRLSPPTGCQG